MANKNETMQMALFCLEIYGAQSPAVLETIATLRTALEQPEKEWVGLTDEEIHSAEGYEEDRKLFRFARAIEAKLKEKNR